MSENLETQYKQNNKSQTSFKEKLQIFIKEFFIPLVIALAIIIPIRVFVAQPFFVQGASMEPNFHAWDYLIVDIFTYKFLHDPQRGDVVIIVPPVNKDTYYIKRIIGLPNETIEMRQGKVIIRNKEYPAGFELKEPYIDPKNMSANNFVYKLGPDEYFVMGDNRAHSSDSRAFGAIKRDAIKARAFLRLFPFDKIDYLPANFKY